MRSFLHTAAFTSMGGACLWLGQHHYDHPFEAPWWALAWWLGSCFAMGVLDAWGRK